ncbi:AraC family transcriptional regulator [Metaclostridioides mangenotii]|uniref:AraC family transcriptional regulator n=1 Tax=Metaclostridioides mangenotii TaxID=1540 RepID=UPI0026ECFED0|nr:AraC family transcriptional regulator [Clostridioides mangenotii]
MEWLKKFNDALDYIEDNLKDEIEYEKAAKIACCSTYHFQRMFSYISGTPISEYIRRRRLTLAAFDLQEGDKVIDVAVRYGYESPTSFNRAFQNIHGISPSAAQKEGAYLKAFPRISFKITIKGEAEMDYRIVKKDEFKVVGFKEKLDKDVEVNFEVVPKMWADVAQNGKIAELVPLMNQEPMGVLGVSACMDNQENWEYFISVSTDKETPDGMYEYNVPAHTWAVFSEEGPMPTAIQNLEKRIVTEWLPTSGYEYGDAPDIEVYINADPQHSKFEVWVPIIKR